MFRAVRTTTATHSTQFPSGPSAKRARRNRTAGAAALAAMLLAAGCTSATAGDLLVADLPEQGADVEQTGLQLWGVNPGDELNDESLLVSNLLSPLEIVSLQPEGRTWVNPLGRVWNGTPLLAYGDPDGSLVVAGDPGSDLGEIASAPRLQAQVIRRGAFVHTTDGCVLARSKDDVEEVGSGSCAISLSERWVASWPSQMPGPLTIRDLRNDSTRTVDDVSVAEAAVLDKDNRIMVIEQTAQGSEGVVIDATNGSEVGRTDRYDSLQVTTVGAESTGFVLLASSANGTELLHVDTDAHVESIDDGNYLVPVINGHEVTYLDYGEDLATSTLKRWSHGHEPEVVLEGYVGAGAIDDHHVVATKETDEAIEFYVQHGGTGELELAYTLPIAEDAASPLAGNGVGIRAIEMWVKGTTVHLQINGEGANGSYVRLDLHNSHSDAPLENVEGLQLEGLDADGTALLSYDERKVEIDPASGRPIGSSPRRIVIVRPHDDEPTTRAVLGQTGTNTIHDGIIYMTDASDLDRVVVSSVRATGKDDTQRVLYENRQIAGATWPKQGGASQSLLITPRLLIEQRQQQLEQEQAMQSMQQGTGTTDASGEATTAAPGEATGVPGEAAPEG